MANNAHWNKDLKADMSDNANCSRDTRPERETSFVDVKSLLDEVIFPLYRPLILNPVQETDVNVAQFRSDPDSQSPRSFRGFIERVTTFKPQTWGADPNAALYFAKHGWRGTTDCNIRCNMCLTSIDCSHVLNKGELWFILAKKGHATLCPFQFISTPDDLFKLPTDPGIIQQNVTKIWGSLITLETELPSITEDVISDLGIENKVVDLFFKALELPVTEFGLSALVLGLCGWVKGNLKNTIECNFCQRCVGLWNFFSIADKTPSLSSQQEPVPSSSSGVPSHEKDAHSPKPASPSICSEHSPSQEIIPSDCEVPLDSNDYVSEECSETSDMESGDGVEEEEDEEGEDFEDYDQSSTMDIPRSMSESRSTGKRKMYDSNSEEHSEDSDEVASRSNVSSYVSFRGQGLDKNMFSVDSSDLLERDRIIQLARKIKKKAIARLYASRVRFADYRARFSNGNSENYVKDSCTKSSLGSVDKDQQLSTSRILSVGQSIDTTLISGSYNDIQEVEEDDSDMDWNRENERALEETKRDEICNGPSQDELPDSNFKLVLECPSSSEADDGSVDPLDTQGVKRTLEDVHGEDLNDGSSLKRRKVGNDPSDKEISSISQCTLVNVKDITNRLSEHGVTLAKCDSIQRGPQSEAAEPRERGTKRKASSMDEEQAETDRNTLHPRKDLANNIDVASAEGLPCEDSNVAGELKNKIIDSDVSNEPGHLCKENSTISVKDGKEGSKTVSDGVSQVDVEIPVDMRNGIDSSKLSSENECEIDSATSHKEGQGKIIKSNKITLHETAVSNGDIKRDPVEGSCKIPNGDSTIVSPDSRHEEKSGSDKMNGKLESESIGPCNSTTDNDNEVVQDTAKHEICIVQAGSDTVVTKVDTGESSKSDHAGAENREVNVNESKGNDETSGAHSFSKSPEGSEISAHAVSNNAGINSSVSEEKKIVIAHEDLVANENPLSCGVEPVENDNCKENVDIEIKKIESVDSESSSCTVTETNINTDKSDVAGTGSNVADTETNSEEKKSSSDVKVPSSGDIKSDVSSGEVEKEPCLSSHGKAVDDSIDEKTDIVSDDKVETSQASIDADKSPDIKEDSSILVDSSENVKDSDISVPDGGLEKNNREDNVAEKLESLSEQKIPVSNDNAVDSELKVSACPVVEDKQDGVMEHSEEEGKDASIDKRNKVDTGNIEDKEIQEEMEISGPPEIPVDDSCEQKEPDNKDASQDCAVSSKNIDEEVVSRKRRHSSVEEEEEQEDTHKKFKSGEPIAKVDFHPIKEHRFWCIYRLNTTTSNGDAKPGWAQLRDGLRLGLSMECVSYDDTVDLKTFRMRLAKHLAHW